MKIGIITYHRSINYGAVTQCYALAARLQKDFPEDAVEVVDYAPAFRMERYKPSLCNYLTGATASDNSFLLNAKIVAAKAIELLRSPAHYRKIKNRYNTFQRSLACLPLSEKSYFTDDPEEFRRSIAGQYDVLVVGSDCVWKWETVPLPSAYFLPGDFGAVKTAFAASCGTDDPQQLPRENQSWLYKALSNFSYIGVRDTSTEYMVETVTGQTDLHHNCDPTTLLNVEDLAEYKERTREKLRKAGVDFSKPIVGIMGNEIIGRLARDIFGDTVQYVGLYYPNSLCDVFMDDLQVLEWATAFDFFDLTITTFFHGTMLSLVNHTPVLSFDYLPETEKQITKLHELYVRLGLKDFYHRGKRRYDADDVREIGEIAKRLMKEPPKEQIRLALEKEAESYQSFYEYLKSVKAGEMS